MTTTVGPKERKLREMREEMIRRTEQNRRLLKGKVKSVSGQVIRVKTAKRER